MNTLEMYRKPEIKKAKDSQDPFKGYYNPFNATGLVIANEGYDIFVYKREHNIKYFVGRKVKHSSYNQTYQYYSVTESFYDKHWNVESLGNARLMIYRLLKYYEKGYDVYNPNFK